MVAATRRVSVVRGPQPSAARALADWRRLPQGRVKSCVRYLSGPHCSLTKEARVKHSLTVLLPVHNVQDTLADTVQRLLEVASELTEKFELVVIDDGSSDATSEIAGELATAYPQVTLVRHGRRLGQAAAIRSGLRHSAGQLVIVAQQPNAGSAEQVRRLYQMAVRDQNVRGSGSAASFHGPGLVTEAPHAYRILDRRKLQQAGVRSRPARPNYLAHVEAPLADS